MSAITLSIVIPTYNRAPLLKFLLQSICEDFESWPTDLELIVLDNASVDETADVLLTMKQACPALQIRQNASNVGMDANLAACFNAGTGRYLWQIGDDELLYRGAATWVLQMCREHDFGLLHLAHESFAQGEQPAQISRQIKTPAVRRLSTMEIARKANIFITFISANVVSREHVLGLSLDFDPLAEAGSNLPHLGWLYAALQSTDRHMATDTPIFGALSDNSGGYRLFEVFAVNLRDITERRLARTLPRAARLITNASLLRLLSGQLVAESARPLSGRFLAEDIHGAMHRAFFDHRYYRWLVRHIVEGRSFRRAMAFAVVRAINRIDRVLGHRLL